MKPCENMTVHDHIPCGLDPWGLGTSPKEPTQPMLDSHLTAQFAIQSAHKGPGGELEAIQVVPPKKRVARKRGETVRFAAPLGVEQRSRSKVIDLRERDAGKTDGDSNPQIRIGDAIWERLARMEKELAKNGRWLLARDPAHGLVHASRPCALSKGSLGF